MLKQGMTYLGGSRQGRWGIWTRLAMTWFPECLSFPTIKSWNIKPSDFQNSLVTGTTSLSQEWFPRVKEATAGSHSIHPTPVFRKPTISTCPHNLPKADLPPPPSSPFLTAALSKATQLCWFWEWKCQDGAWNKGRVETLALWTRITTD